MTSPGPRDLSRIKPSDLPSPSQACLRVIKEASHSDVKIEVISRTIAADPAFTAELLRTVNSPYYSVRSAIATVPRAIMILGWRNLRSLALTFAVRDSMKNSVIKGPLLQQFWENAMRRAAACNRLALRSANVDPDEAFTVGLLQDFGTIALFKIDPAQITHWDALMSCLPEDRADLERERFGTTHDEVARLLASRWGLPDALGVPISFHHAVTDAACPPAHRTMARIASTADLANAVYASSDKMQALEALGHALQSHHGMQRGDVESFLTGVAEEVERASAALNLRVTRPPTYEEILCEANRALVSINGQEEERSRQLENMLREQEKLTDELERAKAQLERLAFLDPLTGLANRRRFEEVFLNELSRATRERRCLSLVMLDIDRFKLVNDTWGHPFGDAVIQAVGLAMARGTRTYDFHARIGGEEMAMVLSGADASDGALIADRVRLEILALQLTSGGQPVSVSASFGGVTFDGRVEQAVTDRSDLARRMLSAVDQALYAAKQGGRNRVVWGPFGALVPVAVAS